MSTNHHRITASAEMSGDFWLFGEEVGGIGDARNVSDFGNAQLMGFADVIFFEIDVFGAFVSDGGRQIDTCIIIMWRSLAR
jgi:hypothetical protein